MATSSSSTSGPVLPTAVSPLPIPNSNQNQCWLDLSYREGSGQVRIGPGGITDQNIQQLTSMIRQIHQNVASLDLSEHGMEDEAAIYIISRLREHQMLVSVNLAGNPISERGKERIHAILFDASTKAVLNVYAKIYAKMMSYGLYNMKNDLLDTTPPNQSICHVLFGPNSPPPNIPTIIPKAVGPLLSGTFSPSPYINQMQNIVRSIACITWLLLKKRRADENINTQSPAKSMQSSALINFLGKHHISLITFLHPYAGSNIQWEEQCKIGHIKIKIKYHNGFHVNVGQESFDGLLELNYNIPLLHLAAQLGLSDCVRDLIKPRERIHPPPVDSLDGQQHTPLFHAIRMNHLDSVIVLLEAGANPSFNGQRMDVNDGVKTIQNTPLEASVRLQDTECLRLLLKFWERTIDFKLDLKQDLHLQLLDVAIAQDNLEAVETILAFFPKLDYLKVDTDSHLSQFFRRKLGSVIENEDSPERLLQIDRTLSLGVSIDSPEIQTLMQYAAAHGQVQTMRTLAQRGADLNISSEVGGNTLIHLASHSNQVEMVFDLAFFGFSFYGTEFFRSNHASQRFWEMSDNPIIQQLGTLVLKLLEKQEQQTNRIDLLEAIQRAHTSDLERIESVVDSHLTAQIESTFQRPHGKYFRSFYGSFCFAMTTEFDGMRAALSKWVSSSTTTVEDVTSLLEKAAKSCQMPGAPIVASAIGFLIKKYAKNKLADKLELISHLFPTNDDSNYFVKIICFHLMEMLQQQLILIDTMKGTEAIVDEDAMSKLAHSICFRLILFMFSKHFRSESLNFDTHNKKELYKKARSLALSLIWFKRIDLINNINILKKTPGVNSVVISLPTKATRHLWQNIKRTGRGAWDVLAGLISLKWNDDEFRKTLKPLTDQGFFQRAPIQVGDVYYQFNGCRTNHYPPLTLTNEDFTNIRERTKSRKLAFTAFDKLKKRTTQSYREILEEDQRAIILAPPGIPPEPDPVVVVPPAAPHHHHWVREDSLHAFWEGKARAVIQHETIAINGKIKKLSECPQQGREKKYEEIKKRINNLQLLGENVTNIMALHKKNDNKYKKIISDGSGAASSE